MMKSDNHIFSGLQRDVDIARHNPEFLWDAHNIRITTRGNSTMLAITNEKGNKEIDSTEGGNTNQKGLLKGNYLGHCVIKNTVVVFTKGEEDYIYKVTKSPHNLPFLVTLMYKGDLNFKDESPIESLGVFENEDIQKVYWVDGVNQPRMIILSNDYTDKPSNIFNFVQELSLRELVHIERGDSGGSFAPGVIQYAFSYYNKYGAETNLFYTSELLYISATDRGLSPEGKSSNVFNITLFDIENTFDYLRIYSIHRTSIDATPTVKIVTDIKLDSGSPHANVYYTDTGTAGETIDPSMLLYIGGESITAYTMTQKDNTLFLGNIELLRDEVNPEIQIKIHEQSSKVTSSYRNIYLSGGDSNNTFYEYIHQLKGDNPSTFKSGDYYRLGVQFQHKNGKWSAPVWVTDYQVPLSHRPKIYYRDLNLTEMLLKLDSDITSSLYSAGYRKARGVAVFPSIYDRMTLAQGILCPTVFSARNRRTNTPFAQSSWFFRPMWDELPTQDEEGYDKVEDVKKGNHVEYRHLKPLSGNTPRMTEIQNMEICSFQQASEKILQDKVSNTFFSDQSVLTFHSPDIEMDDSIRQAIHNNKFSVNLVGLAQFTSVAGDITVQTSTPVPAPNDEGFFHKSLLHTSIAEGVSTGIVSGFYYKSHIVDDSKNAKRYEAYKADDTIWELNWLVYPWQRSGSLNNDCTRPTDKGTRSAVLKKKVISNLRVSKNTEWFSKDYPVQKNPNTISIFDSDQVSLLKIAPPLNSDVTTISYYGNVDTIVPTVSSYDLMISDPKVTLISPFYSKPVALSTALDFVGDYAESLKKAKEPVRMKYKSTPHAVFALDYSEDGYPRTLPSIGPLNKVDIKDTKVIPFWVNQKGPSVPFKYTKILKIKIFRFSNIDLVLAGMSRRAKKGDIAMIECDPTIEAGKWFDLYICTKERVDGYAETPEQPSEWEKIPLTGRENTLYKYIGPNNIEELYSVKYNGTTYALCYTELAKSEDYKIYQDSLTETPIPASLYVAEIRRTETPVNLFGGTSKTALQSNLWLPVGQPVNLEDNREITIKYTYGDTFYQRYDCLKTYPFTHEDENSIVDIASFMCETRVNIDGRYDRNRGQLNNLYMSPTNFNLVNPVYSQRNTFFNYRILDDDYYKVNKFPTSVTWSLEKENVAIIDKWTRVSLANIMDLDGDKGAVNALRILNDNIVCFQDSGISNILFNSRVQIPTSEGTPIEISNNYKVDGKRYITDTVGCTNKWSIVNTPSGIYFIDSICHNLYNIGGNGLASVSNAHGMGDWFTHQNPTTWVPTVFTGIRNFYDIMYNDLYITTSDSCLVFSEMLGQFTSFMSYENTQAMFNLQSELYAIHNEGDNCRIWKMFEGEYNKFYNQYKPFSITFTSNAEASTDKTFTNLDLRTDFYNSNGLQHRQCFDYIRVNNEYQDTGVVPLTFKNIKPSNLKKKFRIWRVTIPRDKDNKFDRIRNTWTKITLGSDKTSSLENNTNIVLHDIGVQYYI